MEKERDDFCNKNQYIFFSLTNATAAFTIILFLILPGLNICYFKNDQELIAAFKTLRVRTAIEMFLEREFR